MGDGGDAKAAVRRLVSLGQLHTGGLPRLRRAGRLRSASPTAFAALTAAVAAAASIAALAAATTSASGGAPDPAAADAAALTASARVHIRRAHELPGDWLLPGRSRRPPLLPQERGRGQPVRIRGVLAAVPSTR
jgi:hypothetical protein